MSLRISGQFRFHILVRGEIIMRLSRHIRETIDQVFRLVGTAQGTPSPTPCAMPSCVVRAPLPYFAKGIFVVSDGTFVYAGGGFDGLTNQVHNDLLRFDLPANSWTATPGP